MTGQPKAASKSRITCGGKEAEDDRINLNRRRAKTSRLRSARASTAWCMVGTAVYQLACDSSSQAKNFRALKPGGQKTAAGTQNQAHQKDTEVR